MSDSDEREISFEEIGLSTKDTKLETKKKIVKLNLKIKRLPKQKNAFKGNNKSFELPNEKPKSETLPKLCNGANCSATDQIMSAIEELRDLVKKSCNETHNIRKEILDFKESMINDNPSYVPFMSGPCQTLDDFNLLENRVQEDEISRNALENVLDKIPADSMEKYVRFCLKAIIGLPVAVKCMWHANKADINTVSVHDMAIVGVICDSTRKKYPRASTSIIVKIMKKWLQTTKDRWRRSEEEKN